MLSPGQSWGWTLNSNYQHPAQDSVLHCQAWKGVLDLSEFRPRTRLIFCSSCEGAEPGAVWAWPRHCVIGYHLPSWPGMEGRESLALPWFPLGRKHGRQSSWDVVLLAAVTSCHIRSSSAVRNFACKSPPLCTLLLLVFFPLLFLFLSHCWIQ